MADPGSCKLDVALVDGPLPPPTPQDHAAGYVDGGGAVVTFDGVVRPTEAGAAIAGLTYQAYEPMTTRELHSLAERTAAAHGLLALICRHSVGFVPNHHTSFRLTVTAPHRRAAIDACDTFIAEMKMVVPLWKLPQADG